MGAHLNLLGMGHPLGIALCRALPQMRQGKPLLPISQHLNLLEAWLGRLAMQPKHPLVGLMPLQLMPSLSLSGYLANSQWPPAVPGPPLRQSPFLKALPMLPSSGRTRTVGSQQRLSCIPLASPAGCHHRYQYLYGCPRAAHVPPAQSALLHAVSAADCFAALTESASAVSASGRALLMGNLNAWFGIRPDVDDEFARSLQALGLPVNQGYTYLVWRPWQASAAALLLSWPCTCHEPSAWRQPNSPFAHMQLAAHSLITC